MKRKSAYILIVCLLLCTGCTAKENNTIAETTTAESTQTETTPETETEISTTAQTDAPVQPEINALVAICMADGESEEIALDTASYMHEKAQELSGTLFGEITSKEDAIAKGRDVLMLIGAGDSVERAESEYVEIDGELVKYERDGEPWHVEHFPEHDAWCVTPALPSGVTEDGRFVAAPGQPPFVILRGVDGAVLGVFH